MKQESRKIKSFTDLIAWQEGHKLVLEIYKITDKWPTEEMFGLISQIRRAVVSATSNLAEGFSRGTLKDKSKFYLIGLGSLTELQNQLVIARDLHYLDVEKFRIIADKSVTVNKLINGLIKKSQQLASLT
jgi:four helix bundle protein